MDKITVVCHKDHDKGYEDYVGKCLLCEVERLRKREWVGLTDEEIDVIYEQHHNQYGECESPNFGYERAIEQALKEKNA